jgi:hypothetical protein
MFGGFWGLHPSRMTRSTQVSHTKKGFFSLTPVIPAIQETEIGRIMVPGQLAKKSSQNPI